MKPCRRLHLQLRDSRSHNVKRWNLVERLLVAQGRLADAWYNHEVARNQHSRDAVRMPLGFDMSYRRGNDGAQVRRKLD